MPRKTLTSPQKALMRKTRGNPQPPTVRVPAAELRPLSPEERLHEHLEAKQLEKAWLENRLTASLKGS